MLRPSLSILAALCAVTSAFAGTPDASNSKICYFPVYNGTGPYVSLYGGANVYQTADLGSRFDLDSQAAWFAGVKLGYAFEPRSPLQFALELDGSYVHDQLRGEETLRSRYQRLDIEANREVHIAPILVNGLVKLELGRFRPYLGGGIGVAYVRSDSVFVHHDHHIDLPDNFRGGRDSYSHGFTTRANTEEWSFAAQGIAGAEYLVTPHLGVYMEYKALWMRDANDIKDYVNHLVGAGVRLYF